MFERPQPWSCRFEADPKSGPPPAPHGIAGGAEAADTGASGSILVFSEADPKSGPPPTDMFFPERSRLRANLLDAPKLALAVGLAWAIMFLIISLVVWISGSGTVLSFFELIYPGFTSDAFVGLLIGIAWSFLYGLLFGLLIGMIYNSLARYQVVEHESWEAYG